MTNGNQTYSYSELKKIWINGEENGLGGNILQSEIAATYIENQLRNEQGLPLRISYSTDLKT